VNWDLIFENALVAAFGSDAVIYALIAIGLNVQFGYTGLLNFGQIAFVACGAYGVAMGVATFGLSLWLGVFLGLVAAIVLALLLGLPTLRLRTDYLAIATIAASEIVRLLLRSVTFSETTGGTDGLQSFSGDFFRQNRLEPGDYGIWVVQYPARTAWVLIVGWSTVAVCSLLVFALMRSPFGRVLKAIREDENAVRSLGKSVTAYKMQSLVLGGVIAALGGVMFAVSRSSVQPDNYATAFTFFAYTALILGGTARIFGPIVGSMVFWFLLAFTDVALRQAVGADYISRDILNGNEIGIFRQVLVGLGLMALMIFRPQGILGDKREVAIDARR
jgi:branched-chain amino acid transport system permease protein